MTPVDQDRFVDPTNGQNRGNCLQAVVASLLDLPLNAVPNFVQIEKDGGREWSEHLRLWLLERGWRQQLWLHGAYPGAWPGLPFEKFCGHGAYPGAWPGLPFEKFCGHGAYPGAWPGLPFEKFCAVYGPSPRGLDVNGKQVFHIVISKGGVMVHDPHPDRTGITESHGGWWLEAVGEPCPAHPTEGDCMVCTVYLAGGAA